MKLLSAEDLEGHNNNVAAHQVDAGGVYIGLVAIDPDHPERIIASPPPGGFRMVDGQFIKAKTFAEMKLEAVDAIDRKSGEVRLRFITDVPGQQATYTVKGVQARKFLANPESDPGSFIVAEALARGITNLQAAQVIAGLADAWENMIGPAIERIRISTKVAIETATEETLPGILAAGIAALDAIS